MSVKTSLLHACARVALSAACGRARDLLSGALGERCENGERDAQQRETPTRQASVAVIGGAQFSRCHGDIMCALCTVFTLVRSVAKLRFCARTYLQLCKSVPLCHI
jgi:hypothetical protein